MAAPACAGLLTKTGTELAGRTFSSSRFSIRNKPKAGRMQTYFNRLRTESFCFVVCAQTFYLASSARRSVLWLIERSRVRYTTPITLRHIKEFLRHVFHRTPVQVARDGTGVRHRSH